jgi:hypothetical protein
MAWINSLGRFGLDEGISGGTQCDMRHLLDWMVGRWIELRWWAWVGGTYRVVFVPSSIRMVFVLAFASFATHCAPTYTDFSIACARQTASLSKPRYALLPFSPPIMQHDSRSEHSANQMDFNPELSGSSYPPMGFRGFAEAS